MKFIKGVDISSLPELEKMGAVYYDKEMQKDLLTILKDYEVNTIRLRIWNNPYDQKGNPYGGGTNDLKSVIKFAKKIRKKDFSFILNFHYSDFWTDPKKQIKPKAWQHLTGTELEDKVYQYTYQTIKELKNRDLMPEMIQIGNEITNGLLWPEGQINTYNYFSDEQPYREYQKMFKLLSKGIKAVRTLDSSIKIIIHLDSGGDNKLYRKWFDEAEIYQLDYDIIGLSYYPYWHGSLEDLFYNLQDISKRYQKDVLIAETAYGFTLEEKVGCKPIFSKELAVQAGYSPDKDGQVAFLKDLVASIKGVDANRGLGFIYWEPAWIPVKGSTWTSKEGQKYIEDNAPCGNTWANQALFDYQGNVLPGLQIIKKL